MGSVNCVGKLNARSKIRALTIAVVASWLRVQAHAADSYRGGLPRRLVARISPRTDWAH